MFNANGLTPFRGKINHFIIPSSHFSNDGNKSDVVETKVVAEEKVAYKAEEPPLSVEESKPKTQGDTPPPIKIERPQSNIGISSLSLSSIQFKKESERKSSSKNATVNKAEATFGQETLTQLWQEYTQEKNNQGENNIAALMEMSPPLMKDHFKIQLTTNSQSNKIELTKELPDLIAHLSKQLNNYKITFDIIVEEQKKSEFIYTAEDKYKHLKKINPEIELLKKEFDLDL